MTGKGRKMKQRIAKSAIPLFLIALSATTLSPAEAQNSASLPSLHPFELSDLFGRKVKLEDYAGRPIFLEFGACW